MALTEPAWGIMGCPLRLKMGSIVAKKPKLGTKRICAECATKYYDLERDPIICPSCGTRFIPPEPKIRTKPAKPLAEKPATKDESAAGDQTVSLEEADAEATKTGAVTSESGDDGDSDDKDDGEDAGVDNTNGEPAEDENDDTFLVTEDSDEDVGTMIGDTKKDEN